MLIYVEGIDKSGKSTFIKELSAKLSLPVYRKYVPKALKLKEHHSYFKGVGIALAELHNLFGFSAIVDRSFVSDWVYTNRNHDVEPLDIWREWENRHSSIHSAIIVYVQSSREVVNARLKENSDEYMSDKDIERFENLYEIYLQQTRFASLRVNGNSDCRTRTGEIEMVERFLLST